jgi:hypothetical protein
MVINSEMTKMWNIPTNASNIQTEQVIRMLG